MRVLEENSFEKHLADSVTCDFVYEAGQRLTENAENQTQGDEVFPE